jgi:hypothetical protein
MRLAMRRILVTRKSRESVYAKLQRLHDPGRAEHTPKTTIADGLDDIWF